MSTSPPATLSTPTPADPNFPRPSIASTDPTVPDAGVFTAEEVEFMESVLLFWEQSSPLSRSYENTDPVADGYDPNLAMLTTVRAKLAALRPTV
jgi:hypothetical protein